MTERLLCFNAYVGNRQDGVLAAWVKSLDPDVAFVSETGNAHEELRRAGHVLFNKDEGPPIDPALVIKAKVDDWDGGRLTQRVHRADKPNMWKDRWYVRARVGHKVYYSIHANAIIGAGRDSYADNPGAKEWARGMAKVKAMIKDDMDHGYAVRVGGDLNFTKSNNPGALTPSAVFNSLGLEYYVDRVEWIAWDPKYDRVVKKETLRVAPGADAHHSILVVLESREGAPKPKPKTRSLQLGVATMDLNKKLNDKEMTADIDWVVKNFDPEIIGFQHARGDLSVVTKALPDRYRLAVPKLQNPDSKANPIAYDTEKLRLIGTNATNVGGGWINVAHLKDKHYGQSIYHFNMVEQSKTQVDRLEQMLKNTAKGDTVSFWSGEFKDAPHQVGAADDPRVKSLGHRLSPDDYFLRTFEITGLKGGYTDPSYVGSATNPNQDPEAPKPVKQKFEKDNGPQRDHDDCCGGEAL